MTDSNNSQGAKPAHRMFSKKYILSLVAMIIILIVTYKILPSDYTWSEIKQIILSTKPGYIIAGYGMMFIYQLCITLSIQLLLNLFTGQRTPFEMSCKSAYIGHYFHSITPFASGGQPMQMYYLNKRGVKVSNSSIIFMLMSIFYTVVLIGVAAFMLVWKYDLITRSLKYIRYFMILGFLMNALLVAGMVLLIVKPSIIRGLAKGISRFLLRFRFIKNPYRYLRKVSSFTSSYTETSMSLRERPGVFIKLFVLHFIQIISIFSIPYLVTRSLGGLPNMYSDTLALQAILYISANSIPTPGAVGITETGFVTMFQSILPSEQVMPAMLLTRLINLYGFLIISITVSIIA
ncbi:MAG TPA: flippase-like domain-containing protein, partial [Clostridiaceae bacterium]|nr:flippase-like domain-containing protein [Clostridiaceae bacterium]